MTIEEVLEYKKKFGKPPRANSVFEVLKLVEDYLVFLYTRGGNLSFNVNLEYKSKPGDYLRLSSSGKCVRAITYSIYAREYAEKSDILQIKDISPRSISVFQLGHTLHELERLLISEVNELVSMEMDVFLDIDEKYKIPGHIDGILKLKDRDVIIDVKTVNEKTYKEFQKAPREDYVKQLNAYMEATGIKEAYLWVYNKGTSHRMIIPIPYDEAIVSQVKNNFKIAIKAFEERKIPPRPYSPIIKDSGNSVVQTLPWQCSYCEFVQQCWPDFKMIVESEKVKYVKVELKEDTDAWI